MKINTEMKLSKDDQFNFENATTFSICGKPCKCNDIECRDHCHRTGKYRGATHQNVILIIFLIVMFWLFFTI